MTVHRRAFLATLCFVVAGASLGPVARGQAQNPARIVAIGDVHGNFEGFRDILKTAGLIDAKQQWSGGKTVFVQTGDLYDRGTGVLEALDLMMRLEGQAKRAGGRVDALLGNHEVVNILGDLRDVAPEMYARFADGRSESRRVRAYDDLVKMATRRGQASAVPARDAWMTAHPPGYIEYTESVGPRGKYGRWIRSHKAIATIGNTAFMHAGITHTFQGSLDDVNRIVADEIAAWDANKGEMVRLGLIPAYATMAETIAAATAEIGRIGQSPETPATRQWVARLQRVAAIEKSPLLIDDGPMWFRGFALWKETDEPAFTALIGRLGIGRFIAGHTPMPQMPVNRNIMNRWNFRIFQIDTGMLAGNFFKGGRPSALEIAGERITAIYTDSREVVVAGGPAGDR